MTIHPRFSRRTHVLMACIAVCFVSSACGILPAGPPSGTMTESKFSGTAGSSSLAAFQTGFYAMATASGSCVQCHGANQAPLFAVSNLSSACNNALPYLNLSNPGNSLLLQYSGNGHCGISTVCGSKSAAVANGIQSWAASAAALGAGCASGSSGGSGGSGGGSQSNGCPAGFNPPPSTLAYKTVPMPIPSPLPSSPGTTGAIVNWNLSSLTPANASVAGSIFQVQVQIENPGTPQSAYRFMLPRMVVPTNATQVAGVHVFVDGCEFPATMTWVNSEDNTGIFSDINPSKVPNPVSTTTALSSTVLSNSGVEVPVVGPNDTVSIGFDTLTTNFSANASFAYLNSNLFSTACVNCHNPNNLNGNVNLSGYAAVSSYINGGSGTVLINSVAPGGNMPKNNPGSTSGTLVQDLTDWINAGAPNN